MLKRSVRRGVTLVEILIGMAILATLAAILYPSVAVQLRRGQSTALANQFDNLRQALANFQQNVAEYPILLTQLTVAPVAGDLETCGNQLSLTQRNAWRGPYLTQNIVGNMVVGDAIVQNTMVRVNLAGTQALLQIVASGVQPNTATDLEAQFDGNANFATGTVLYDGTDVLRFQIPIRGC
jgi:prepilin-type N-terminal cleavage/methylation domain-containing protein